MAAPGVAHRVRVSIDHGLSEQEAMSLSRYARALPFELHLHYGRRRIDARSIVEMLDLSHMLGDEAVIELEAEGDGSLEVLDRLAEVVGHPTAPARDELAFFGLVGASGRDPAGCPSLGGLDPAGCLQAISLASGAPPVGWGPRIM